MVTELQIVLRGVEGLYSAQGEVSQDVVFRERQLHDNPIAVSESGHTGKLEYGSKMSSVCKSAPQAVRTSCRIAHASCAQALNTKRLAEHLTALRA